MIEFLKDFITSFNRQRKEKRRENDLIKLEKELRICRGEAEGLLLALQDDGQLSISDNTGPNSGLTLSESEGQLTIEIDQAESSK